MDPEGTSAQPARRSQSWEIIAFVGCAIVAVAVLLWLGRGRWFKHDEWDFLAARHATSLHDLFAPHVVHWSTLPILVYRLLWQTVGLRSYIPYEILSIVCHVSVAVLLRVVMRRAGVRPWTATVIAAAFLFFGAGYETILMSFGMTFSAAIALGLIQLVLADHEGRVIRRDHLGLLAGFAALLCSGIAVSMVVMVGVACLVRRGWRAALFHTAPLGGLYLIWYAAIGSTGYANQRVGGGVDIVRSAGTIADATGHGLSQVPHLGWVLIALLLVGGLALAWSGKSLSGLRQTASLPIACVVGGGFFLVVTAIGRWDDFQDMATPSRYVYVAGALFVPAIGVAADALIRRWRATVVPLALLLLLSVVGNIRSFPTDAANRRQIAFGSYLLTLPRLPAAAQVPDAVHPDVTRAPWVTLGWLREAAASGRAPVPGHVDPADAEVWELGLVLRRQLGHHSASCQPVSSPAQVRLERGGSIKSPGSLDVVYTDQSGAATGPITFSADSLEPYLVAYAGPLDLRVTSQGPNGQFLVCDQAGAPVNVGPAPGG
jgi:hypothetical protein